MEWVSGELGQTRLSGVITREIGMYYRILIEEIGGPISERLACYQKGAYLDLMKPIVERKFVRLNDNQLRNLRDLSLFLKDFTWTDEIEQRLNKIH